MPSPPPPSETNDATTEAQPFDGGALVAEQSPNAGAPFLDLRAALRKPPSDPAFRCATPGVACSEDDDPSRSPTGGPRFEYVSLDELAAAARAIATAPAASDNESDEESDNEGNEPAENDTFSLSQKFNSDEAFRNDLRSAIRLDVFETTPFYANLPAKAKSVLLLPDSSLEGSWRIRSGKSRERKEEPTNTTTEAREDDDDTNNNNKKKETAAPGLRMKHTTRVLREVLEEHHAAAAAAPTTSWFTGDDLFEAIGAICGDKASTHWIDIYGVQDRTINHSWHLDAGRSPGDCRTVLWGFPPEDNYEGTGVFSHIVSLEDPFGSTVDITTGDGGGASGRPRMEPVLFEGGPGEEYVFRPDYAPGKELLVYRDVDVLHSAPDVAYRTSVMRFM